MCIIMVGSPPIIIGTGMTLGTEKETEGGTWFWSGAEVENARFGVKLNGDGANPPLNPTLPLPLPLARSGRGSILLVGWKPPV